MYGIIYKATNLINSKIYIGKTTQTLEDRIVKHYSQLKDDTYFHRALKKYPKDNWHWEEIDIADSLEEINEKERYWISFYKAMNPDVGYNRTEGGDGPPSMDKINYDKSRETRLKRHYTEEELKAIEEHALDYTYSRNKPVQCLETGEIFSSPLAAAEEFFHHTDKHEKELTANAIRKNAGGQTKTARKYHWRYLGEEEGRQYCSTAVMLVETGEIFRNITQASLLTHQKRTNILNCCKGLKESTACCHWQWINK